MKPLTAKIKKEALDKWDRGRKATEDTYLDWWEDEGISPCSFCKCFVTESLDGKRYCDCPLRDNLAKVCAVEFCAAAEAAHNKDYESFHLAAEALYSRISNLSLK